MQLLLVRHGETDWNVERRIQGWANSALTDLGYVQIGLLGKRLLNVPIAAIYSSDAERAQLTAKAALGGRDQTPIIVRNELRETSWGRWEGKTGAEIGAEEPVLWQQFVKRGHQDPAEDQTDWEATTLVPGGETVLQASTRINGCISCILADHAETDDWIVVVGHGGSLRFVITSLLGLRPSASRSFHLDNASITHFSIDKERTVLRLLNDCSHWAGGRVV